MTDTPRAEDMFLVTATASGEVRDSEGRLVETVHGEPQQQQVPASVLAQYPDETLRLAGLSEDSIKKIRGAQQ